MAGVLNDTCKIILLDIEGTITSISFVKDVLFPFVRSNLKDHLESEWTELELTDDVNALREQAEYDTVNNLVVTQIPFEVSENEIKKAVLENVLEQMDDDRKTTALKQLQGHMWRKGYEKGKLVGHLYDDVLPVFEHWTQEGKKIFIYSSGSVEAQKLLFGYSKYGNLRKFISGHFDTKVGPKFDAMSYRKIAKYVKCPASDITFFTDIPKEAAAARRSGMTAILVERDGNAPLEQTDRDNFQVISSFTQIINK